MRAVVDAGGVLFLLGDGGMGLDVEFVATDMLLVVEEANFAVLTGVLIFVLGVWPGGVGSERRAVAVWFVLAAEWGKLNELREWIAPLDGEVERRETEERVEAAEEAMVAVVLSPVETWLPELRAKVVGLEMLGGKREVADEGWLTCVAVAPSGIESCDALLLSLRIEPLIVAKDVEVGRTPIFDKIRSAGVCGCVGVLGEEA